MEQNVQNNSGRDGRTDKVADNSQCCPPFDPVVWDRKTHIWKDKLFIKDSIPEFMHIPFPPMFAKKVSTMWKKAEDAGAAPDVKDFLLMATDPSPWKSELYMTVTKEVPSVENVKMTGEFVSKVFDGPFNAVPKWIKEMDAYLASEKKTLKKYYVYFPLCPKCAEKYGKNYGVVLAEVE